MEDNSAALLRYPEEEKVLKNIVPIATAALVRLQTEIQFVVEENACELHLLPLEEQVRVGSLLFEASQRAYFDGVDIVASLAKGYGPAMAALNRCFAHYRAAPKEKIQ